MDVTDQRVLEKFSGFERKRDPALVIEALEAVEAVQRNVQAGDAAAHARVLSNWLQFFAALDRHLDPTWDPKKVPVKGAAPPPVHGVVFPSGEVDPSTIPDPAARAEYVKALKASADYREWFGVQLQLRRVDERAMRVLEQLFVQARRNSEEDERQLEQLLAASPVDQSRKERIRALQR